MWLMLRNTARRGRESVPSKWRRIRSWRLRRAALRVATCVIAFVPSRWTGSLLAADLAGLAGLAADLLAGVADTLALVGLGLARGADGGRDLADQLLVDADDREAGGALDLEADALGRVDLDRVAVAQVELELAAVERGSIADARDLEALPIAVADPDHHVVDEGPREAVELLVGLLLGRAGDHDGGLLAGDGHVGVERPAEGPLGALDRDVPPVDGPVARGAHGDAEASDT